MSSFLAAEFPSYRKAQEAAYKLSAIRAENIGIELATPPAGGDAPLPAENGSGRGGDAEFADDLPLYEGDYRLTACIRPEIREQAERIIRDCGGRTT